MKLLLKVLFATLFVLPLTSKAEMLSWVLPVENSTNITTTLSKGEVMEFVTVAGDSSLVIDVTANDRTITFGQGTLSFPYPFAVAGPATVTVRKTSTGGDGGLVTVRMGENQPAARPPLNVSSR